MTNNNNRVPNLKEKFIDGEFLYRYYFQKMGIERAQRKLPAVALAHGMTNILGRAPSWMGCWKAMWRWACIPENHQEAYEIYNTALQDYGRYVTFDEFKDILRQKSESAIQFNSDNHRKRFFRRNGLA